MVLSLHLARALLFLIAACLAPSLAYAHPGHAHSAPAAYVPAVAEDVAAELASSADEDVSQIAAAIVIMTEVTNAASSSADRMSSGCAGRCCGAAGGLPCCGAVQVPEISVAPCVVSSCVMVFTRADPLLGLPPEALPKPPKSFA